MRMARCQAELTPIHVTHIGIWTQLYNIPLAALTKEGIEYIVARVRTATSDVQTFSTNGRVFLKVKISYQIDVPLKDHVTIGHPTIRPMTIHLVYDKLSRVCRCCGGLGHEISACKTYAKILQLAGDPMYGARLEVAQLKKRRKGEWMTSAAFVPRKQPALGAAQTSQSQGQQDRPTANAPVMGHAQLPSYQGPVPQYHNLGRDSSGNEI